MYVYSETEGGCYFNSVFLFLLIYLKISFLTFLDITIWNIWKDKGVGIDTVECSLCRGAMTIFRYSAELFEV